MMLDATSPLAPSAQPMSAWPLRPAVGFLHPLDVVEDPDLDLAAKRQILASWASDASAVEEHPSQRWLLGPDAPAHLAEIQDALRILVRRHGRVGLARAERKDSAGGRGVDDRDRLIDGAGWNLDHRRALQVHDRSQQRQPRRHNRGGP